MGCKNTLSTEKLVIQGSAKVTHWQSNTSQCCSFQKSGLGFGKTPGLSELGVGYIPKPCKELFIPSFMMEKVKRGEQCKVQSSQGFCTVHSPREFSPTADEDFVLLQRITNVWLNFHHLQWDSLRTWILQLPLPGVLCSSSSSLSVPGCLKIWFLLQAGEQGDNSLLHPAFFFLFLQAGREFNLILKTPKFTQV